MGIADSVLTSHLQKLSLDSGAELFGIASAADFADYEGKRSPYYYLKDARSVIVIGCHMTDPLLDTWKHDPATDSDFCAVNEKLGRIGLELIEVLLNNGYNSFLNPYSGIYSKDAAVLANLGVIGKNNLLITEEYGPRVRLRAIITEAVLEKNNTQMTSPCASCPCFCWSACPVRAFESGKYNRDICANYSNENVKKLGDNEFLFCRECELACPAGKQK